MGSTEVGAIHYSLNLDDSKFKQGLEESKGRMEAAEGSSKGLLLGLTAMGAAATAFGFKSVQAFNESAQITAQLEAVIRSTGGAAKLTAQEMQAQATALQQLSGVSDEAVLSGQAMLATFTNISGPQFQGATQSILDMSTAMNGGAIPSSEQMRSTAILVGKALNDPAEGLTRLTRVGVTFTEAQKEQIAAMQAAGNTAGAQQLILQELNREFGGSAEAAGKTFAGQLNILKETFGDVMGLIGAGIVNVLQPVVRAFNDWFKAVGGPEGALKALRGALEGVQPWLPVIAGVIGAMLVPAFAALAVGVWAAISPLIPFAAAGLAVGLVLKTILERVGGLNGLLNIFKGVWDFLRPSVEALFNTIATQLLPALQRLWDVVGPILIPVIGFLARVLGATLIGAVWAAINVLNIIIGVISGVINILSSVIGWVSRTAGSLAGGFSGVVGAISRALGGVWDAITGPFRRAFDWLKGEVDKVAGILKKLNPFARFSPSLYDLVSAGTKAVTERYADMFSSIADMASGFSAMPLGGAAALAMPGVMGSSSSQVITHFNGPITIQKEADADQALAILGRDQELASRGLATQRGSS